VTAENPVVILLHWDGGETFIFPDVEFAPFNAEDYELPDGSTLAHDEASFKNAVRERIRDTLTVSLGRDVRVLDKPTREGAVATIVLVTGDVSPAGGSRIGEAEYDACNATDFDSAVVFGRTIARLAGGREFDFDDWVQVFANVCAHEAAHTLGFGHIPRRGTTFDTGAPYVELMLEGHTMEEMRRPQRVLTPQDPCGELEPAAHVHAD
jgi:hypothetical protein